MSIIYLAALTGVALVMLLALYEAVASVSRPADWSQSARYSFMHVVETQDRRTQQLPFVGVDRRRRAEQAGEGERHRAA